MKDKTKLITAGRPHSRQSHPVNPPVERASTILFPTYDDYLEGAKTIEYGRLGRSTHRALEEAITALEGGYETRLAPSGLQACNVSILSFVETGDHVLITDSAYDPTRKFCKNFLSRFGVSVTFYDPMATRDEVLSLATQRTRVIFSESPGSLTFEVQDLPMLAGVSQELGAKLIVDNTWSAGYFCKPISLGADVSIQAATKYIVGHADCLLGSITAADELTATKIYYGLLQLGSNVSADDAYLALRGMRTLSTRMDRHQENGLALAKWLSKRSEVKEIIHPAFKECPGHSIWKRDFTGASGLFGIILYPIPIPALKVFFNSLRIFGIGFSWGGYESLCLHVHPAKHRSTKKWSDNDMMMRIHAGLEDIEDMKTDLDNAFSAMSIAVRQMK